jgi:hypothetical protein
MSAFGREFALRGAAESCHSKFGAERQRQLCRPMIEVALPAEVVQKALTGVSRRNGGCAARLGEHGNTYGYAVAFERVEIDSARLRPGTSPCQVKNEPVRLRP